MTQDQSASRSDEVQEWIGHMNLHLTEHDLPHAGKALRAAWPHVMAYLLDVERERDTWRELAKNAEAAIRSEQQPSEQGSRAIALVALLGDTAPIRRWKEYEDRGEERIPCFIDVETAKAIAEFFPKPDER